MKKMEQRILQDGQCFNESVLKVDSFVNQQIDAKFILECAEEFYKKFKHLNIKKIVTIEASGISIATCCGLLFNVPVVFFKKEAGVLNKDHVYVTHVHSFTKNKDYQLSVNKDYLHGERVLFVDDFLANGEAAFAAKRLLEQANCEMAACAILIEKSFQAGRKALEEAGLEVYSLARVKSMKNNIVEFVEED